MKVYEMDILNQMSIDPHLNQKELALLTGYSVGLVNACIKKFKANHYIDQNGRHITLKTHELLAEAKPFRAIILAAGYGMRMVPINMEQPKGLLCVKGEVLVERLIRQLHESGINEIIMVVGFMKEAYEYLIDRYGVTLLVNPEYGTKNNLFSLLCAKNYLSNCYVLPCDIWCRENLFRSAELHSWYMVSKEKSKQSTVCLNRKFELKPVKRGETGNRMVGIAYITKEDGKILRKRMEEMDQAGNYTASFWEEAFLNGEQKLVAARIVNDDMVREINTYEELKEIDGGSIHLQSDALCVAASALGTSPDNIHDIVVLKKGMTNRSFRFSCGGKRYIMRIPGEGTDLLINRQQEADVYHVIAGKGLCDDPVHLNPITGYKITSFLDDVRCCDPFNYADVQACMKKLREFHEMKLQVNHEFDIFGQIEFYERLWDGEASAYKDYQSTKANVFSLKSYIDTHAAPKVLTHIDAVPDNFLFCRQEGREELQITDWEYAGMQDPHVDIAMFCIYSMYDKTQVDKLISIYFDGQCPNQIRLKIYCYIAACGLLWSNWCEYKRMLGVEFGEYSLRQYRYAKEYYRVFQSEYSKKISGEPSDAR